MTTTLLKNPIFDASDLEPPLRALRLPNRQIHLDFHTSPLIPDLLSEFDPDQFAATMAAAHVNSVTVFAKCHHGMSYYPTALGQPHPALGTRDLLGEMIAALHAREIEAPIYYTVGWEERLAALHPEWQQMRFDGSPAKRLKIDGLVDPDLWRFMSYLHPEYLEHMRREVREIAERYPVDGMFFDIVFSDPDAGFEPVAAEIRRAHGIAAHTPANQQRWNALSKQLFAESLTPVLLERHPQARPFYNSAHSFSINATEGLRRVNHLQHHWEIESLPSGVWGYHHFPRFARHVASFSQPWLGMTGRFQRSWGDFGGIKPQAALEFECFRSQAHGGGNSVGDQLPPRGQLDPTAYELFGAVFEQLEASEAFYEGSTALFDVAVMLGSHATITAKNAALAEEGAVLALEEMHYNPAVLDDAAPLDGYRAVILTDTTVVTPRLQANLANYYASGGSILVAHRGGCDECGQWALPFLPVKIDGELEMQPTYWRARAEFWPELSRSDRVFYERGLNISGGQGTNVLVERVLPYFERSDEHFMGHFQAPPVRDPHPYPAVIAGERFAVFADPVFGAYRHYGATVYRDVVERVLRDLIGWPLIGAGLPRTVLSVPRRRGDDLIVTLLHYIPIRKAIEGDVIEERSSFAGEALQLNGMRDVLQPHVFAGLPLERRDSSTFNLPMSKGRLLVEVSGYFALNSANREQGGAQI